MRFRRKKYRLRINGRGRHNYLKKCGPILIISHTKKVPKRYYSKPFFRRML